MRNILTKKVENDTVDLVVITICSYYNFYNIKVEAKIKILHITEDAVGFIS